MPAERLIVRQEEPLNAETPLPLLCRAPVTPAELFFVRNHGPIPLVDEDAYRLTVGESLELSLDELRARFPRTMVAATLVCAGNRRADLVPAPEGIPWGAGAIGSAEWTGVRLRDVLRAAGIPADARHVAFTGREGFHGSIPIEKALAPEVLLAFEMNGEPLSPEHGFPLRAVVPGYVGARSIKWLSEISLQRMPSRTEYTVDGGELGELPLNSALCESRDGVAAGYAISARPLDRVEVSPDGGRTWTTAILGDGGRWTWRLWHADVDAREILVRAFDESSGQPANGTWNERGYMNNAWQRVRV